MNLYKITWSCINRTHGCLPRYVWADDVQDALDVYTKTSTITNTTVTEIKFIVDRSEILS